MSSFRRLTGLTYCSRIVVSAVVVLFAVLEAGPVLADEQLSPEEVRRWTEKGIDVANAERQADTGLDADGKRLTDEERQNLRNRANETKNVEVNFTSPLRRKIFYSAYYDHKLQQLQKEHNSFKENDPRREDVDREIHQVEQQRDAQLTAEDQREIGLLTREAEIIVRLKKDEGRVRKKKAKVDQAEKEGVDPLQLHFMEQHLGNAEEDVWIDKRALRSFRNQNGTRFPDYTIPEDQTQEGSDSGGRNTMGNGSQTRTIPLSGQTHVVGGQGAFQLHVTGGFRFSEETPEHFLGGGDQTKNQGTADEPKKTWTSTDSQSSILLESSNGGTFNVNYSTDPTRANTESTVFVTAGYQCFTDTWSTVIPRNYSGMAFENIDLTVDVTATHTTSLVPGIDPWVFQQQSIQQGYDLSKWRGAELPFGSFLEWAVDEQTFSRFTQQNAASIQYSEPDAVTNIAPVPFWDPRHWPASDDAQPLPHLRYQR